MLFRTKRCKAAKPISLVCHLVYMNEDKKSSKWRQKSFFVLSPDFTAVSGEVFHMIYSGSRGIKKKDRAVRMTAAAGRAFYASRLWAAALSAGKQSSLKGDCCVGADQIAVIVHMYGYALLFGPAAAAARGGPDRQHTPRCTARIRRRSWQQRSVRPVCA